MKDTTESAGVKDFDEEFFEEVHKRFEQAKSHWEPIFAKYIDDTKFVAGDMWISKVKAARKAQNLSCLTIDKVSSKISYIVNNVRGAMPGVKVHPVKDGADENTAKVYDGLIKSIAVQSNAKAARITAHKCNVTGGLGAYRILVVDSDDGEKDLAYERVTDPTKILIDPAAKNLDFSDANWAFVISWIPEDDFKEQYDIDPANFAPSYKSWYVKDMVQIVEYWCRGEDGLFDQYLITADNVLDSVEDYAGKYLPILYLTGIETYVDDMIDYRGVVRPVRDMQILHNLSKSVTADYIARAAQAQWLAEGDQIADYKDMWSRANVSGAPVLLYKGTASGGKPQRIDPVTPPTGAIELSKEMDEDIRMTIGIRDPLADIPASQSGKAIQLQVAQGNQGTAEFADKLNEIVSYEGKILLDLIPKVLSYAHIRQIIGIDDQVTSVPLNQTYEENGQLVKHDLTVGKYTCVVTAGPSYESQRTETADKLIELVGKYPNMMQVAGDLIVRNMDFVGKDELADRLKATIPQNVLAASNPTNNDSQAQQQALAAAQSQIGQAQQENQQLQIQLQQLQQELSQAKEALQTKAAEINNKAESDIRVEQTKAQIKSQLDSEQRAFEMHMETMKQEHELRMAQLRAGVDLAKVQTQGAQKIDQIKTKADTDAQQSLTDHSLSLDRMQEEETLNLEAFDKTGGQDILNEM